MNNIKKIIAGLALAVTTTAVHASTAGFEDLTLAPETFFTPASQTTFSSDGATFIADPFNGWFYSNTTDQSTANFTNASSAYHLPSGGGAGGSNNFAMAFDGSSFGEPQPRIEFGGAVTVSSAALTNSTYSAQSMLMGDGFAKKFGGVSGNDADFFSMDIIGLNGATETGRVAFFLADYRFDDNDLDYIVDAWTEVVLSDLGVVTALEFRLYSSDTGGFGINTPAYFALDDLNFAPVPLAPAVVLLLAPLAALARFRRPTE